MAKEKFNRTNVDKIKIGGIGVHEGRKIPTPIITDGVVSLDVNKKKAYVHGVETTEECFYGIDVISLVLSVYGKDSEVYKAMATGKNISSMIEESLKKNLQIVETEKMLLHMCKEIEESMEQSNKL